MGAPQLHAYMPETRIGIQQPTRRAHTQVIVVVWWSREALCANAQRATACRESSKQGPHGPSQHRGHSQKKKPSNVGTHT